MPLTQEKVAIQREVQLRGCEASNVRAPERCRPKSVGRALHPNTAIRVEPASKCLILEFRIAMNVEIRVARIQEGDGDPSLLVFDEATPPESIFVIRIVAL